MSSFPTEIWCKIFYLACTDTGVTGRSLSLVSRAFAADSSRFKLRSISLTGVDEMSCFIDILMNIDPKDRHTENLFVSNYSIQSHVICDADFKKSELADYYRLQRWTQPDEAEVQWSEKLSFLLRTLQHTLRVLTIHGNVPRTYTMLPIHLPNLSNLTVHTPIMNYFPDDESTDSFLHLRYLSLAFYPVWPPLTLCTIPALAPNLKSLFLYTEEKLRYLRGPLTEALWAHGPAGQFWSLDQVHIQPSYPPNSLRTATSRQRGMAASGDLHELVQADNRLVVHRARRRWSVVEAQSDWLASIGG